MSDLDRLRAAILSLAPDVTTSVDAPADPMGHWFLDVRLGEKHVTVEWRPRLGQFGLGLSPDPGYGEGPDEICDDVGQAARRVVEVIKG